MSNVNMGGSDLTYFCMLDRRSTEKSSRQEIWSALVFQSDGKTDILEDHQWLSEFVTQYWLSMYYSSRGIKSLTAIFLF
jgi:hypothetical protein